MNTILKLAALVTGLAFASSAVASEPSYGNAYGCQVAATGNETNNFDPNWILVTPKGSEGHEWSCNFGNRHGNKITASCSSEGQSQQTQIVTLTENRSTATITYTDAAGRFTLHRCR